MKTTLAAVLLSATALGTAAAAEPWGMDPAHTDVMVSWDHAGFSTQVASFHEFSGSLTLDLEDISATQADFTVPVSGLSTGLPFFDDELKGPQFFNVDEYPNVTFVSTSATRTGDMSAEVTGDMTILGVTKQVTFEVEVHNVGEHPVGQFFDAYKGTWMGVTATAQIKRSDFGMEAFIPVGSDEITIEINSEFKQGVEQFSMGG